MKFIVSSTDLLNHLLIVSRVINSKNSLPILDDFLFNVKGHNLEMVASDMETTIITSMPIEGVQDEGSICIRAALLMNILKEFADQPLTFDVNLDNMAITIRTDNGHYEFMGDNAEQFPSAATLEDDVHTFTINCQDLLTSLNKTAFAVATDETRPIMTAICFDLSSDMLTTVATDAHKMVRVRNTKVKGDSDCKFTLSRKPTSLLKNIIAKEEGDADIQFDAKNISFNFNNYRLICRQIEGNYPNYNAVIPTNNEQKLIVKKSEFIRLLRRVSVFSNQASNMIKLDLEENNMRISAQDLDYSNSAEEQFTCQYDGAPMTIGFKSTFLVEMLSNIDTEDVEIDLADSTKAALLFPFNDDENALDVLMLLMPIMV